MTDTGWWVHKVVDIAVDPTDEEILKSGYENVEDALSRHGPEGAELVAVLLVPRRFGQRTFNVQRLFFKRSVRR